MKKIVALALVLAMCAAFFAGCTQNENSEPTTVPTNAPEVEGTEPVATEPVAATPNFDGWSLQMYMPNNKDFEAEGCYGNALVEEVLNMDWEIVELDNWNEQYNPMMAKGDVPALTYLNIYNATVLEYGEDGAYINIFDYLDQMPNVKAYLENPDNARDVAKYTTVDGKMYCLPIRQTGTAAIYGYIYREDIFAEHGLNFPTTQEEFVEVLRALKEKYPDSYPFVMRQMTNLVGLQEFAYQNGVLASSTAVNNAAFTLGEDGKYYQCYTSNGYKEVVTFFKQLLDEGLMHPSSMTMDTAGWTEAFASGTSFIGFDKMDRIPSLENAGVAQDEDFNLIFGAPIAMGENGKAQTSPVAATNYSFAIGDTKDLENTLAFVDWLYSEEGITTTNWGKEGESYTVDANGEKSWNQDWLASMGSLAATGLNTPSICGYKDFDAYLASLDESLANSIAEAAKYNTTAQQVTLSYTDDEKLIYDSYTTSLITHCREELAKFILGQRDIAEWDQFEQELKDNYFFDELLKIHEDAYARTK